MALGPDGQPSPEAIVHYNQWVAESRENASHVTGAKKIFSDAASAIEKISADVEAYWQAGSARYDALFARDESLGQRLLSAGAKLLGTEPEIVGNENITNDIAGLENLLADLPEADADMCRRIIGKTKEHISQEKAVYALERKVDAIPVSIRIGDLVLPDFEAGLRKMSFTLQSAFAIAGARGRYHDNCDRVRDHFFRLALEP